MASPKIYWLTGLSGAGKTTIAEQLYKELRKTYPKVCMLDGDVMRLGLCRDLGFDEAARMENMRRIGEVVKLFCAVGVPVIAAFISPYQKGRDMVRHCVPSDAFIEVYVSTPLEECERRDPKGLYQRARRGEVKHFTGISAPYEVPLKPEVTLDTIRLDVDMCVQTILQANCGINLGLEAVDAAVTLLSSQRNDQ